MRIVLLSAVIALAGPIAEVHSARAALDPLVAEVVRLLEADVSEAVIRHWIEAEDRRPGRVGVDDLLALEAAGASDALITAILDRATPPEVPPPTAPPDEAAAELELRVEYRPQILEHREPWSLVVYLDGVPVLATVGSPNVAVPLPPEGRTLALAPGVHTVRLLQERHVPQGGGRWRHEARACPATPELELTSGSQVLELAVAEVTLPSLTGPGAVRWRLDRGNTRVAGAADVGGATADWPSLCEEVVTRIPESKLGGAAARRALSGCVEWRDLWPGGVTVPDRSAAREQLLRAVW